MGQDICSNVNCTQSCYIVETPTMQIVQEGFEGKPYHQHNQQEELKQSLQKIEEKLKPQQESQQRHTENEVKQPSHPQQVREQQIKLQEQQKKPHQFDIRRELQQLKKMFSEEYPRPIYLSIDKTWQNQMRFQNENLQQVYTLLENNGNKVTIKRSGNNSSKRQILFRQHFPIFGTFYFEIEIQSYELSNGCEFVIGVVNHLEASLQLHSRDRQYEQSFVYKKQNVHQARENQIVYENIKLRLQIDRQNNMIRYYVKGIMQKEQKIKQALINEVASLAPYIQTRYTGVVFSWERVPLTSTKSYKMSTIIEQGSSNITI